MRHQTLFPANVLIFYSLWFISLCMSFTLTVTQRDLWAQRSDGNTAQRLPALHPLLPTACPDLTCRPAQEGTVVQYWLKAGSSISHKAKKKAITRPSVPMYFCWSDYSESLPCTTGTPQYCCWAWKFPQNKGRTAAASSGAQSPSSWPWLTSAYHAHKVHLRLQRWTETYVLVSSVETWAFSLTHSWFSAYCPPPPQPLSWDPSSSSAGKGRVNSTCKVNCRELSHQCSERNQYKYSVWLLLLLLIW